jgi:plastocyanin
MRIDRIIITASTTTHDQAVIATRTPPRHTGLRRRLLAVTALLTAVCASTVAATPEPEVLLVIRDHRFDPAELKVPANQRVKLIVHNQDSSAEEFESRALNREKMVPAQSKVTIFIGPLKPGRYAFVGEYHEATAKGVLVAE